MIKIVYLICRLAVLILWPAIAYMFASGHDGDDCSPWVYPQGAIYAVMASILFRLMNISHVWRYIDDLPSLSVLRCKLNTVLPLTLAQVFYCCVHGFSPENRHYWRTFFPYCSPVTQLQRYGSTCFTWGYTRGLVQNRPRHAWSH